MKKFLCLILATLLIFSVACANNAETSTETDTELKTENKTETETETEKTKATVKIGALKGPTGMGLAKLFTDADEGKLEYNVEKTIYSSTDEIVAEVIKGSFDIAAVPSNLAATLYNKTEGKIKVVAVNTLGVLSVIENGNEINSVSDLKGKTIYATGQGATPEYVLNYILEKNGINPETDVEIIYLQEHSELATKLIGGEVAIGVLPEPNVSSVLMQNEASRIALDLTEEWNKVSSDSELIQGVVIASAEFAENNKELLDAVLDDYSESVNFANTDVDTTASLVEALGILPKAAIAKKAIPSCHICFYTMNEYKEKLESFLNVLYEQNPKSVGGNLPDSAFYYEK